MAAKKAETEAATTEEAAVAPADQGTITIDGKEISVAELSQEAKGQIQSLRFVETELQRLQAKAAVLSTAKQAYANKLKTLLTANED